MACYKPRLTAHDVLHRAYMQASLPGMLKLLRIMRYVANNHWPTARKACY